MGFNAPEEGSESRSRLRVILVVGALLIAPTAALAFVDELSIVYCGGAILVLIAYLIAQSAERWLSSRAGERQVMAPGCAIDVSSVAQRLNAVRAEFAGRIEQRAHGPFHAGLLASAAVAIRKRRFFSDGQPELREAAEGFGDLEEP